jgi:hypothetical protein
MDDITISLELKKQLDTALKNVDYIAAMAGAEVDDPVLPATKRDRLICKLHRPCGQDDDQTREGDCRGEKGKKGIIRLSCYSFFENYTIMG